MQTIFCGLFLSSITFSGIVFPMDGQNQHDVDYPFHAAARSGDAGLLLQLLNENGLENINTLAGSGPFWGNTPLHEAASRKNVDCIRVLLEAGADTNIYQFNDLTFHSAVELAAIAESFECVELLLAFGANRSERLQLFIDRFCCIQSRKRKAFVPDDLN